MAAMNGNKIVGVYGGQWGSEGKGQVIAAMTDNEAFDPKFERVLAVRVGGPNAGHTATASDGEEIKAQSVPIPMFLTRECEGLIGPGGTVLMSILKPEIERLLSVWDNEMPSLTINPRAVVIGTNHMKAEEEMKESIASTGEGVGAATAGKVMRTGRTVGDVFPAIRAQLPPMARLFVGETNDIISKSENSLILLEGTQGYHLSLNAARYYPFCTSRDCGPDALVAQCATSYRAHERREVVCVFRTFPIRVGGNSGPLPDEIDWDILKAESDGYVNSPELTTVTKKIRRIARWNWDIVMQTVFETAPDHLAITFLDYLFPECANAVTPDDLTVPAWEWLSEVERRTGVPVKWVSTGAGQEFTFSL